MLDLKDFFHLPEVDVLLAQAVNDPRGITVVAGLGPRSAQVGATGLADAPGAPSDRSTIAALLLRHTLDRALNGRKVQAVVVGPTRNGLPVANHQRRQVEIILAPIDHVDGFTTGLQQAMMRNPDLLAIDRLNTVTAQATFHAAAAGRRILTQIDTTLVGGDVLQEIVGLGCSPSQMSLVSWVIAVQRVPALCTYCKQPHRPGAALVETMTGRHALDPGATFYAASGCRHCQGTGYSGELTAFDVFRVHGGVTSFSELVSTPSLLPLEGYLARLAAQGYVPLEDAARLSQSSRGKLPLAPAAREAAPDEAARVLQRKLVEIEAANKVLAQRVDALLSLQEIGRVIGAAMRLDEIADRVAHYACELSGADRAILYLIEPGGQARVLAVANWDAATVGRLTALPASLLERGEPESMVGAPPGVDLPPAQLQALQAGLRVPLVADDTLVGVLVVNSLYKTRFAPVGVLSLKALGDMLALAVRRAGQVEALYERLDRLEAEQSDRIEAARREREFELARTLQARSLPDRFPSIRTAQFAAAYRPAREVGCDRYDVIDLGDGKLGLLIADVAGRGLPAAYGMGLARSLILSEAQRSRSPREVLAQVNRALVEVGRGEILLTAFYGVFDAATRHLVYCRAGHARPLWLRADGHDVLLSAPGLPIGLLDPDELDLGEGEIYPAPGDTLVFYTDGLIDALDPYGAEFGLAHWLRRAREHAGLPVDQMCVALFDEVAAFQAGAPRTDDMALLVMRVVDS